MLAVAIVAYLLMKAWFAGKTDYEFAKQGKVSPRLAARYGGEDAARDATGGWGLGRYLRLAWGDHWRRRSEALLAARDAEPADSGGRVRLRDRLAAAGRAVGRNPVVRTIVDPVPPRQPRRVDPEPVREADPPQSVEAPPPGTWTVGPDGERQPLTPDNRSPEPGPTASPPDQPAPAPTPPTGPSAETGGDEPRRPTDPATSPGGTPMTAPTGEVINYETHLAELDAQIAVAQSQVDAAQAAVDSLDKTAEAIDQMQQTYTAAAQAAQTKLDHTEAANLDGTTQGHGADAVDAMPPNKVNEMYDQLEEMKALAAEKLALSEQALAALEAERAHIVAEYGELNAQVADKLGGQAGYVDSSGGAAPAVAAPVAEPVGAGR